MSWKDNFPKKNRYFETENGILYNADCVELLKEFPEKSIDLILTDPPYRISQEGKYIHRDVKYYRWKRKANIKLDFGRWDRLWNTDGEYLMWIDSWFSNVVRCSKGGAWLYIFFDKQKTGFFDLLLAPNYKIKARTIYVWAKTNPTPSFCKVNWNSATEHIWVGTKGESKIKNFKQQKYMSNYFLSPNSFSYGTTNHPTEKPIKLFLHLIDVNSFGNDLVLDPFIGSGTTAVACEKLGRCWIGIEISEKYCELAKRRIKIEADQIKLFY